VSKARQRNWIVEVNHHYRVVVREGHVADVVGFVGRTFDGMLPG
jgi:hypothetical protein